MKDEGKPRRESGDRTEAESARHASAVRKDAEDQVEREAAIAQAADLEAQAAGATAARERAEAEQLVAARERAQRRQAEEETEQAEQHRVDSAREAEDAAHEAARAARRPGRDLAGQAGEQLAVPPDADPDGRDGREVHRGPAGAAG